MKTNISREQQEGEEVLPIRKYSKNSLSEFPPFHEFASHRHQSSSTKNSSSETKTFHQYLHQVTDMSLSDSKTQQLNAQQNVNTPITHVQHLPIKQQKNTSNKNSIQVFVRVRPLNEREKQWQNQLQSSSNAVKKIDIIKIQDSQIFVTEPESLRITEAPREKQFNFDGVFSEKNDTFSLYSNTVSPLIRGNVLEGYNATVFAYGQTGAGKTYTLLGYGNQNESQGGGNGIVGLSVDELFALQSKENNYIHSTKVSYLEIYNETVRDLLVDQDKQTPLLIVEDPSKGIMVPELSEFIISSASELNYLIKKGNSIRVMASTHSNQFSSRSHCILSITLEKTPIDNLKQGLQKISSKLTLIDLAGSERAAVSDNKGIRMVEGSKINKSLLALGNCINILSDHRKIGAYVPYRDSKLTRLLKDSLGGNTQTLMIACIAPTSMTYEETLNTLKYAARTKNIQNTVKKNISELDFQTSHFKQVISSLKMEIESLKIQLEKHQRQQGFSQESNGITDGNGGNPISQVEEMEELSKKIFLNIEENWEITTTMKDLDTLRKQNETKRDQMISEQQLPEADSEKKGILEQELQELTENMENNERVYNEMHSNLQRNNQEKQQLRDKLKQIVEGSGQEKSLEDTCRVLQLEKIDLCSENYQIKRAAESLAMEKEQTVIKLQQMEKEMMKMKKQLLEKDQIISQSSIIIHQLKSSNPTSNNNNSAYISNNVSACISGGNTSKSSKAKMMDSKNQREQYYDKKWDPNDLEGESQRKNTELNSNHDINSINVNSNCSFNGITQMGYSYPQQQQSQLSSLRKIQSHNLTSGQQQQQDHLQSDQRQEEQQMTLSKPEYLQSTQKQEKNQHQSHSSQLSQQYQSSAIESIHKEYYYFDQNKKLQKRGNNSNNKQLDFKEVLKSVFIDEKERSISEALSSAEADQKQQQQQQQQQQQIQQQHQIMPKQENVHQQSQQQQVRDKKPQKIQMNLDSLKRFEEIQKGKGEDKQVNAKISNNINKKMKKRNKHINNINNNNNKCEGVATEQITIQDLKNYAQKISNIDFQNVKIKPDLKKFKKNGPSAVVNVAPNNLEEPQLHKRESSCQKSSKQTFYSKDIKEAYQSQHCKSSQEQILSNQFGQSNQNLKDSNNSMYKETTLREKNDHLVKSDKKEQQQKYSKQQYQTQNDKLTKSPKQQRSLTLCSDDNKNSQQSQQFGNKNRQLSSGSRNNQLLRQNQVRTRLHNDISEKNSENGCDTPLKFERIELQKIQDAEDKIQLAQQLIMSARNIHKVNGIQSNQESPQQLGSHGKQEQDMDEQHQKYESLELKEQNEEELSPLSEISLMKQIQDNSVDQTLQEFIVGLEQGNHPSTQKCNSIKQQQQYQQQQSSLSSSSSYQAKFQLKTLDEARVKIRSFKHQIQSLSDKIKSAQVTNEHLAQIKQLIKIQEQEKFSLTSQDEQILKEFKRILIVFKDYQPNKNMNIANNHFTPKQFNKNLSQQEKSLQQNLFQSQPTLFQANLISTQQQQQQPQQQQQSRPRSIQSFGDDGALQVAYFQNSNIKDTTQQKKHAIQSQNQNVHHAPNNISVNKRNIEQGAFSKILHNYGEAAKVIQPNSSSSSSQNSQFNNNKKVHKPSQQQSTDQSRQSHHYEQFTLKKSSQIENSKLNVHEIVSGDINLDQNIPLSGVGSSNATQEPHSGQSISGSSNNVFGILSINMSNSTQANNNNNSNANNYNKQSDCNKNNNQKLILGSQQYLNLNINNNNSNNTGNQSSSSRGKSVTSYMSINSKKRGFKEDGDKGATKDQMKVSIKTNQDQNDVNNNQQSQSQQQQLEEI